MTAVALVGIAVARRFPPDPPDARRGAAPNLRRWRDFLTGSSGVPPRPRTRSRAATGTTTGGRGSTRPTRRATSRRATRATTAAAIPRTSTLLARARLRRVPLLDRVVAHRARGRRVLDAPRSTTTARVHRRVPRPRPAAGGDVPPLHDAALGRGRRRLGQPRRSSIASRGSARRAVARLGDQIGDRRARSTSRTSCR